TLGPPTAVTTVVGLGFGPNDRVKIRFDATVVGRARADPTGAFSTVITVPAVALPGDHLVIAKGRSGSMAQATFTVRSDWPKFHFDLPNSGFNPYENVVSTGNVSQLSLDWHASPSQGEGGGIISSIAVSAGVAYAGASGAPGTDDAYV